MIKEQAAILNFFNEINDADPSDFVKLIKQHNINYKTLIPFASWSNEKYTRICLNRNEHCELIMLCWMPNQETKIHDHDNQDCQVYFAKGQFQECNYAVGDPENCLQSNIVSEGEVTSISQPDRMHSLKNTSNELALTLHLYTNPIDKCAVYSEPGSQQTKEVELSYDDYLPSKESSELVKELEQFVAISKSLVSDELLNPISERIPVEALQDKLDIQLHSKAIEDQSFYKLVEDVVLATPKTSSKLFFNQLFGGRQNKAVLGDLLAVMLNNSMYTYKVAGVQVGIEKEILNQVLQMAGYSSEGGGTFPTGGSMSNFMAILMARDKYDSASNLSGISTPLIAYTSEESHYSIQKNAAFIGLGRHNVSKIESDSKGRLNVDLLEDRIKADIKAGRKPFFVNATAGTTVLGAFDDFIAISKICQQYDIWMHIDGAYSGAALLSEKYRHLLNGVEYSDSFSFNPHKMLGTPMTCSIILVNNKKHLYESFTNDADYLYQTDADDYNLGKTSFQCGRRNDALKLWTLWKSVGTDGLRNIVDQQFLLADVARDYIANNPNYTLYSFEDSVSICFNYKDIDANELCTALYENDKIMVGFGQFKGIEFVRLVTVNASNKPEDIINFFKVLEAFADANF